MMNSESNQAKDIKLAYIAIRDSRKPLRSVNDIVAALNGKGSPSIKRNVYHLLNSENKLIAKSLVNGETRYTVAKPLGHAIKVPLNASGIRRPRGRIEPIVRFSYTDLESRSGRMYNVMHLVVSTLGPYPDSRKLYNDCKKEYETLYKEPLPQEATFSGALTIMIVAANGTITGERSTGRSRWRNIRMRENAPSELPKALELKANADRNGQPLQESLPLEAPPVMVSPPPKSEAAVTLPKANGMTDTELEAWCGSLSIKTAKAIQRIITKLLED
jgi:hypothetical protein